MLQVCVDSHSSCVRRHVTDCRPTLFSAAAQVAGTRKVHKVLSTALDVAVPTDMGYCGLVHLFLVLDSDVDILEINKQNNVGHKQVTVICPRGEEIFSLVIQAMLPN